MSLAHPRIRILSGRVNKGLSYWAEIYVLLNSLNSWRSDMTDPFAHPLFQDKALIATMLKG
jgi:hypothetical protein